MRAKLYSNWQSAQGTLAKKREAEVKLQVGGKPEKLAQIKQEIEEVSPWWYGYILLYMYCIKNSIALANNVLLMCFRVCLNTEVILTC